MGDYIIRGTAAEDSIRFFAASTTGLVQKAHDAHQTSNVATAALGRLLTGGAIMGSMMKNSTDVLTLKIDGNGPLKGITVTANSSENGDVSVKGYCLNPSVEIPLKPNGKLDVGGAVGAGILNVIKDMGLKEPFAGQTELVNGEIAEDLTYYFAASEQTPSAVALGVLMSPEGGRVMCAGGLVLQLMPFASDEVIDALEKRVGAMFPVTTLMNRGMTPEQIVEGLFAPIDKAIDMGVIFQEKAVGDVFLMTGLDVKINDRINVDFRCDCSKAKVAKAIMSIDAKEIEEMIGEGKPIEVNCHFCNSTYSFSVSELAAILEKKKQA